MRTRVLTSSPSWLWRTVWKQHEALSLPFSLFTLSSLSLSLPFPPTIVKWEKLQPQPQPQPRVSIPFQPSPNQFLLSFSFHWKSFLFGRVGVILCLGVGETDRDMYVASMRKSFKDSLKVLEADIQHANTLWAPPSHFFVSGFLLMNVSVITVPTRLVIVC